MLAILFANFSAYVVFMVFPVAFSKPMLGSSLNEWFLALEYAVTPGANIFPSLHVVFAWIICFIGVKQGFGKIRKYALLAVSILKVKEYRKKNGPHSSESAAILAALPECPYRDRDYYIATF
jgi:hypothetical protein